MKTYRVEVVYTIEMSAEDAHVAEESVLNHLRFRAIEDHRWLFYNSIKAVAEVVTTREEIPL